MDDILELIFTVFFAFFGERLSLYALWSPRVQPTEKKKKIIKVLSDIVLISDIVVLLVGAFLLGIGVITAGACLLSISLLYIVAMLILTGVRRR